MGAKRNSNNHQKCGEILINIKTIKNKSKTFTFHCAVCSMECDQLKKFSKHLEKHLHIFDNLEKSYDQAKVPVVFFEPEEIKVEDELDATDLVVKNDCKIVSEALELYEDPLKMEKSQKSELNCTEGIMSSNIKNETKETANELVSCENSSIKILLHNDQICMQETVEADDEPKQDIKSSIFLKELTSDEYSNSSSDIEFDIIKESKTSKNIKSFKDVNTKRKSIVSKRRKETSKKTNENDPSKSPNNEKRRRRRRDIIETIIPFLIQLYKKHTVLWQVDDIAFGIKNKRYEIYGKIAEALKLEANENISLEDINYHIHYLNELYSKDKEQELKCKIEQKEFLPNYKHYEEMSFLSDSQGPFLCAICNEILPRYDPYCQHMAQHNDTQPFKCPTCEMLFTHYHKYIIHKKRHLGILNFHCDMCGKGYLFKNDLEWHVTSHTGVKPYLCPICGTGFRARHGYDNHVRRHEDRYRHECHICKKGFNQLYALNNHVKSHLNIRDVICKICGKGFVHTKYLKRHELIHGTEKHYKCNECGKSFFQACGLRSHRKNHHF